MAHYMIYIPGETEGDDDLLDKIGLNNLRNSGLPTFWQRVMAGGPDGADGMLCAWLSGVAERDPIPSEFQSANWVSSKAMGSLPAGRFWVGMSHGGQDSESIALPRRFNGHAIVCADGRKWHIPAAAKLPHQHGLNSDGEWERKVAGVYQNFVMAACNYAQAIFDKHDAIELLLASMPDDIPESQKIAELELSGADVHCCNALMMNYRLCPELIDMFGLLDDNAMIGIISATIDLPEIQEVLAQKKTYSPVGIPVT